MYTKQQENENSQLILQKAVLLLFTSISSVAQSCPTLCSPMNCRTSGFPIHHQLLDLAPTHVHQGKWCHPTISLSVIPLSSCLQPFPAWGSFPRSQFFASGGRSIGASASASVLPMNIQKTLRVSSSTTVQSINSLALNFLYSDHRTGKGQFSFQFQRKAIPKNVQTTAQLHSSHTLAK